MGIIDLQENKESLLLFLLLLDSLEGADVDSDAGAHRCAHKHALPVDSLCSRWLVGVDGGLDGLQVVQESILLKISPPKENVQVSSLIKPVLNLAALEIECGASCSCSISSCSHRATQKGVNINLRLSHHLQRGWGVTAMDEIKRGAFVAEYVGEEIRNDLADERLARYDLEHKGHALLIVRQVLSSGLTLRSNIDATSVGNIARFVNHSCDPNLELVIIHRSGSLLPSVALFAVRDISPSEELSFSYGTVRPSSSPLTGLRGKPCFCGTSSCKGMMPAE